MKNKFILISGGTASGKTAISNKLQKIFFEEENTVVPVLSLDNYYKTKNELKDEYDNINWDNPNTINWKEFEKDIKKLENNKTVSRKIYSFKDSDYIDKEITIIPSKWIIIEGIFVFQNEYLFNNSSFKFFVNSDEKTRFLRRKERDQYIRKKEFSLEEFLNLWNNSIQPSYKKYVEPTKSEGIIFVRNNTNNIGVIENIAKDFFDKINNEN